jgi:hypothetical protein
MLGKVLITLLSIGHQSSAAQISPYSTYRLETLCGRSHEKQTLDLHNQAHVFTFNSTNTDLLNCHLELQLHTDTLGFAVFTETMKLERTKDCTKDFVQFGRDFLLFTSHKSAKKCGTVEPTKRILREDGSLYDIDYKATAHNAREYIEAVDKEMDIWLSIHPPKPGKPSKELKLIVTPFKKSCVQDDHYYRKCPGTDKCIKQELFCDGIINCDGAPKDEQEEYCLFASSIGNGDIILSIPIIILIVVFSIVGLMFFIFIGKLFTLALKRKTREPAAEAERRALHDPISTTLCDNSNPSQGLRALHSQLSGTSTNSTTPSAPSTSESEVETLPPHPPPYSEVVGTVYKDAPPKYTEHAQDQHEVLFKN